MHHEKEGRKKDVEKSLKEEEPPSAVITPGHYHQTDCQDSNPEQCCEDEHRAIERKKAQLFRQSNPIKQVLLSGSWRLKKTE